MKLSEHFTLDEAEKSNTAIRLGIDNTAPADIIPSLEHVAQNILEPVRAHYGVPITPSSWYRCPLLNAAVNSKPTSQHIKGQAVDFEIYGVPNDELAQWVADNLEYDQLLLEFFKPDEDPHSGWLHVSLCLNGRNRHDRRTIG